MKKDLDNMLHELGISNAHRESCRMPVQTEETNLVQAENDMFDREQFMTERTLECWQNMKAAALKDGIELKLVSAFRSVAYQCDLIKQKLDGGRTIDEILRVNTIPGYSEHHTGCALDLHAGDGEPLEESFDEHQAFAWLNANAAKFNFYLTYPKDNPTGIAYEPWHWCYRDPEEK